MEAKDDSKWEGDHKTHADFANIEQRDEAKSPFNRCNSNANEDEDQPDWVDHIAAFKKEFGDNCEESAVLSRFFAEHAQEFADKSYDDLLESEHEARHAILHNKYLLLWEREMEAFCQFKGIELAELQEQMHDALTDRYTPLFEEHPHHGWVDSALAALSYTHFFNRMLETVRSRKFSHK